MATLVCKQSQSRFKTDMFGVKENDCVGFDSIWKVKRVYSATSSQTVEYEVKDTGIDATPTASCETQTDEATPNSTNQIDEQKLSDWIQRIYPTVSKELSEATSSQAFKNYNKPGDQHEAAARLVQTLKVHGKDGGSAYKVAALSWNCTGNTLAVACSHAHKIWCHHPGLVCLYTFDRDNKLPGTPRKKLLTETCVTVACFHPTLPAVIAAGTFSGVIVIWNTQYDEGDNIICKVNGHEEYVTQMSWMNAAKTSTLRTSSLDGYLNVWNFSLAATTSFTIKEKYRVKGPILGKVQRQAKLSDEGVKKSSRGIITFDYSPYIPDVFVVGAEGGLVIQCSSLGTAPLKESTKDCAVSDPTYKYYEGHEGEVVKVLFSPHRKEMFLSTGTDGEIRIYILGQDEPAQVIFVDRALTCISWVPHQNKILAGCGTKGVLEIYKLISGRAVDVKFEEKVESTALTQMELNRERASIVAVGSANGTLQIWSVPWSTYNYDN